MEMGAQLVMTIGQQTGTGSVLSGKGMGVAGEGTGQGFSSTLGQLLGGNAADGTMNELSMSLAALLGGMLPNLKQLPEQQSTEKLMNDVNAVLEANPELMAAMVNMPQMQQWLLKAQPMVEPTASAQSDAAQAETATFVKPVTTANMTFSTEQAKDIVAKLLQSVKQEPGSLLFAQLVQDLTAIINSPAVKTLTEGTHVGTNGTPVADAQLAELAGPIDNTSTSVKRASTHVPSKNAVTQTAAEAGTAAQNRVVYTVKPDTASSKLELLAAKSVYNVQQALFVTKDNSDTSTKLVPLDAENVQNTLPVADQTMLLSLRETLQNANADAPVATDAKRFVQDMSQYVIKNFKVIENGALSEAKLSLTPANLGHVDVKISMHEGQVVAHFVAQTAAGKEMLESQLPQLRVTLQNLGLQVERLDVSHNSSLSSGMFQDQRGGQSSQQSPRQHKNSLTDTEQPEDFATEMQTIAELRNLAYGARFNVTA